MKKQPPEQLQLRFWLRSLSLAKRLFKQEEYTTEYLQEIEEYLKKESADDDAN